MSCRRHDLDVSQCAECAQARRAREIDAAERIVDRGHAERSLRCFNADEWHNPHSVRAILQSAVDELQGTLTLEAARHADTSAALKYATEQMGAERAEHEQTRKALEESGAKLTEARTKYRNQWEAAQMSEQSAQALESALESTRAELAKAEARVKAATSSLVKSIGQCSHCGERAPLMEGAKLPSHKLKLVCVYGWGCSSGEALDG